MESTYKENYARQVQAILVLVNNGMKTYEHAAEKIHSEEIKELFKTTIAQREIMIQALSQKVRNLGGSPDATDNNFFTTVQRNWQSFKASASGSGDQELLEACRNSELAVLNGFDEALQGSVLENISLKNFLMELRFSVNESFTELDRRYFELFNSDPSLGK